MALYKNVASQKVAVYAWDTSNEVPKTGDAANITARISKDGGAVAQSNDVNPTELDSTHAKGIYLFDLTQAESNCDLFVLTAVSATSNIVLEPVVIYTLPGTNGGVHSVPQSLSTQAKADVNAEVDTALVDINLDHLVKAAVDTDFATTVQANSVIGHLADNGAGFDRTTDSLEALRDRGDAAWTPPAASAVADAVWDEALSGHLSAGSTGNALNAAGSAGDPWATSLPGTYGAGSAGKIIGDNLNATISSRASQASLDTVDDFLDTEIAAIKAKTDNLPSDPADESSVQGVLTTILGYLNTEIAAILAAVDTEVAAIKAKTDNLPASPAAAGDAMALTTSERTSVADALLKRDMSAVTGESARSLLNALRFIRNKWSIVGTTLTVTKEDDSTTAWTATVSSTDGADPVTGSDPS